MAVRVKICGLTRPEDIACAVEAGADALGFVFETSSPRYVGIRWPDLLRCIPPYIYRVAVFGPAPAEIPEGVHAVQALWGDSPARVNGVDLIRTVRLGNGANIRQAREQASAISAILLDSFAPGQFGGTGLTVDWNLAQEFVEECPLKVVLAGGLTPENVAEAIQSVRPFGVDVSSGVETSPGIKSQEQIRRFIHNAKRSE